jgi:hypothetical protein
MASRIYEQLISQSDYLTLIAQNALTKIPLWLTELENAKLVALRGSRVTVCYKAETETAGQITVKDIATLEPILAWCRLASQR